MTPQVGVFCFFFGQLYLALGSNSVRQYFGSRFDRKLDHNSRVWSLWRAFQRICSQYYGQKKQICENLYTYKPHSGVQNTPFLYGVTPSKSSWRAVQIRSQWGKTCSLDWEKIFFQRAISAFLAMFTEPQDVLTCFDRFIKTVHDVNVRWEFKNRAKSLARNRERFKCILGYSTRFYRVWWTFQRF